jgi:hypothetical protein
MQLKGLRRKDAAMKNSSWYFKITDALICKK